LLTQHLAKQSCSDEARSSAQQLAQKEELAACLQTELVKVRLREAENEALVRDLRDHIQELEEVCH
jgi:hypothetical protein